MSRLTRVQTVSVLDGFRVRLTFSDNVTKDVDLEPLLRGPIFQPIRDDARLFRQIKVDARAGTIVWPNGADIDPDVLRQGLSPAWSDDSSSSPRKSVAESA